MSNSAGVRNTMMMHMLNLRLAGLISKREYGLFKQIIDAGVNSVYMLNDNSREE